MAHTNTRRSRTKTPSPHPINKRQKAEDRFMRADKAMAFDKIRALIVAAEDLGTVLRRENAAIRQRDIEQIRAVLNEKLMLTKNYETRHKAVAGDRTLLTHLDKNRIAELKDVAARLEEAVLENGRLLKASIDSSQYTLNAMTSAVSDAQNTKTTTYTNRGRMSTDSGHRSSAKPMTLDQSL